MATADGESRFTRARTLAPPVIIWSAIVAILAASPSAFWISQVMPAALQAASINGRSKPSQRSDDFESGRMNPAFPPAPAAAAAVVSAAAAAVVSAAAAAVVSAAAAAVVSAAAAVVSAAAATVVSAAAAVVSAALSFEQPAANIARAPKSRTALVVFFIGVSPLIDTGDVPIPSPVL